MRTRFRFVLATALLGLVAQANALTIGTLDNTRTNTWLADPNPSSDYSEIRSALTAGGNTLVGTGSINASFLNGVDVFLTSVFNPFSMPAGATLTAEVTALTNWVNAGGTVIFSGERGNPLSPDAFSNAFNKYTTAFGITMGGVDWNYNAGVSFVTNPTDPYLANGVSGGGWAVNNRGWIESVTGPYDVLATSGLNPSELFAVSKSFGQGRVVAFADTYFLTNAGGEPGDPARQFLLNAVSLAGVAVTPVPEPETWALMLAGFGLLGVVRRRSANRPGFRVDPTREQ